MAITYIRNKLSPLQILAWGYVGAGGLGEFDTETYEEIVGVASLPNGYQLIRSYSIQEQLDVVFNSLPMESYTPEQKSVIYTLRTNVENAVMYNDYETASWLISSAELDPEDAAFTDAQAQMLVILS